MLERYVVVDLEMTGLNPRRDRILEIGAARVEHGEVTAQYETFVNPGVGIPEKVRELTGITDEMVKDAPRISEILPDFIVFCADDIFVGHNVIFDYSFLKQAAINEKLSFERQAVDTLKLARKFLPELEHRSLEYLCGYYGIDRTNGHRALFDALATKEVLERLIGAYGAEHERAFEPKPLVYKAKRQTPATQVQKTHLKELLDYHKISIDLDFDTLTRSEASRLTDQILAQYGKIH